MSEYIGVEFVTESWPGLRERGKHLVFARFAIPLDTRSPLTT
jgi:hypothetical protein